MLLVFTVSSIVMALTLPMFVAWYANYLDWWARRIK